MLFCERCKLLLRILSFVMVRFTLCAEEDGDGEEAYVVLVLSLLLLSILLLFFIIRLFCKADVCTVPLAEDGSTRRAVTIGACTSSYYYSSYSSYYSFYSFSSSSSSLSLSYAFSNYSYDSVCVRRLLIALLLPLTATPSLSSTSALYLLMFLCVFLISRLSCVFASFISAAASSAYIAANSSNSSLLTSLWWVFSLSSTSCSTISSSSSYYYYYYSWSFAFTSYYYASSAA